MTYEPCSYFIFCHSETAGRSIPCSQTCRGLKTIILLLAHWIATASLCNHGHGPHPTPEDRVLLRAARECIRFTLREFRLSSSNFLSSTQFSISLKAVSNNSTQTPTSIAFHPHLISSIAVRALSYTSSLQPFHVVQT